ncbi:hypothetical protein [Peristeroidobacter agariperforans]|uniref:hypothetical protein n=1 Tax=Peristeroidobacter agariperforans TaxID=268404 RepID=UPI001E57AAEB|nr:hypothetical protein [Peristeroidobacter agariperforans]
MSSENKRAALAQKVISDDPSAIREEHRDNVLKGVVAVGMTPFEARLAGGAFTYHVKADPAVWPRGANPMRVLEAQTLQPDASVIAMTFRNSTQFATAGAVSFTVEFSQGRVAQITTKEVE